MVQIIEEGTPKRPTFTQKLAHGVQAGLSKGREFYDEHRENEALKKRGIDVTGVKDPHTRAQIVAHELAYGKKKAAAEATEYLPRDKKPRERGQPEKIETYQKESLPEFVSSKKDVKGSKFAEKEQPVFEEGRDRIIPKRETTGQVLPVKSPDQLRGEAMELAERTRGTQFALSDQDAYGILEADNNQNIMHNQQVRAEDERIQQAKEIAGQRGVNALLRYSRDATPEQQAYFQKLGENLALQGGSPADIEKKLAEESNNFKSIISSVENAVRPRRIGSQVGKEILGTTRSAQSERNELKLKLQPLLDLGLYDTARNILSKKGYALEERESLVSSLPEAAKKAVSQLPNMSKDYITSEGFERADPLNLFPFGEKDYSPEQKEMISNSIRDIFTEEPTTNLILLRRDMENKGIDWRIYNDEMQKGILEGYIKLNDDQRKQLDYLQEPPLDRLGKVSYWFGFRGK